MNGKNVLREEINLPTPMVLTKDSLKVSSVYLTIKADLPTPESPIIKILKR